MTKTNGTAIAGGTAAGTAVITGLVQATGADLPPELIASVATLVGYGVRCLLLRFKP